MSRNASNELHICMYETIINARIIDYDIIWMRKIS